MRYVQILKRFLFLLCFATPVAVYANPDIAAILQKINAAGDDSNKVNLYKEAIGYYKRVDMDSASRLADEGLKLAEKIASKPARAFMLLQKGYIEREQGKIGLALAHVTEALDLYTQTNNQRFIAIAKNELGVVYGIKGNYRLATSLFLDALKVYEQLADTLGMGQTYMKLGVVNEKMNNLDKAMSEYKKALQLSKAKHDSVNMAYLYNNMGIVEGKVENNTSTFRYFDSGLALCRSERFTNVSISLLLNSGIAHARDGNEEKALEQYNQALDIARKHDMLFDIPNLLLNVALLDHVVTPDQKIPMLKEALALAKESGEESLQIDIYQTLADVLCEKGDYKQALFYKDTCEKIEKEVFSIEKNKEIANLQALYELDRSKAKVKELEQLSKEKEKERIGIIIFSAALVTLLFFVLHTYRKTKLLNQKLESHREELARANSVKDKIFSIIGHDLRAPLSMLLGSLTILDQDEDKLTKEERKEIYNSLVEQGGASLETLNKLLFWGSRQIKGITLQQEQFDIKQTIADNVKLVGENAAHKGISVTNSVDVPLKVFADQSHVDFVVRNLLFNAIKYTRPGGKVEIGWQPAEAAGEVCIYVKDDGIGMNEEIKRGIFELKGNNRQGTNNEKGTGLGLLLCKGFLDQNGGRIWLHSEEHKGSTFYFTLKTV